MAVKLAWQFGPLFAAASRSRGDDGLTSISRHRSDGALLAAASTADARAAMTSAVVDSSSPARARRCVYYRPAAGAAGCCCVADRAALLTDAMQSAAATVDEFLEEQPEPVRADLMQLRTMIRSEAPGVLGTVSYAR